MKLVLLEKISGWFFVSSFVIFVISMIAFISIGYTEKPQLIFFNSPFPVPEDYYSRGDSVRVDIGACSYREGEQNITRRIKNLDTGDIIFLADVKIFSPKGCGVVKSPPNLIPDDLPGGTYIFEFNVNSKGLVRNFDIQTTSESFRVRK